jgi:hypothetical protein
MFRALGNIRAPKLRLNCCVFFQGSEGSQEAPNPIVLKGFSANSSLIGKVLV